jgi:hypothetical protein
MLVCALAVAAAVGIVAIAAFTSRKLDRDIEDREPGGPTAGHAGSMLSSLFLLAFAIAIVVPWTTADAARQNTYAETHAIVEAYWSAAALPAPLGNQVQSGLRDYVRFVVDKEWPLMRRESLNPEGWSRLDALRVQVAGLAPTSDRAAEARTAVLDQFRDLSAARRQRGADARATPPPGLLAMTLLTGVLVIVFPFLAGARPRGMTLIPLTAMAALLGIGAFLTFDISHVFVGALAVGPDAFLAALQEFQLIPSGR